jgi:hypothetical protein
MNNLKAPPELRNGYKNRIHLGRVATLGCMACAQLKPEQRPKNRGRLEIHHKTGCGLGKKASDLLTIGLCRAHHQTGGRGVALHKGIDLFEEQFGSQQQIILEIHEKLGVTIYKNYLLQSKQD